METKIIEASNRNAGGFNYGKFMVARFDEEWGRRSIVYDEFAKDRGERPFDMPLLRQCGHAYEHVFVMDIQTGEGAMFKPGGLASADLDKHQIWVCPLFEPFLMWLYKQDLSYLRGLPDTVEIDTPESAMRGYRRPGSEEIAEITRHTEKQQYMIYTLALGLTEIAMEGIGGTSTGRPAQGIALDTLTRVGLIRAPMPRRPRPSRRAEHDGT